MREKNQKNLWFKQKKGLKLFCPLDNNDGPNKLAIFLLC